MNIGERVGDYEIVAILGSGGMGEVYKVRSVISDRMEAMKVLLPNLGSDTALADRFLREIKVQAALDHPNIARMNSAQQVGNQLVMLMEYVEGSTIDEQLHKGPLELSESLHCTAQVLDALAYAHARGVVHRDIKPANIMITPSGVVKLMDFGIARMQADRQLTKTGTTVGSLYYMSPEQINGGQPDPRSDLYSLGVTLYEMVTGRRPFVGDSDYSIMAAHLQNKPVAPMEIIAGVPLDLNDIIMMAIAKDPERRFQKAEAFRAALGNFAGSMGVTLGALPEAAKMTPTAPPPRAAAPTLPPTATGISVPPPPRAPTFVPAPPLPATVVQPPAPPVFQAQPGPAPVMQAEPVPPAQRKSGSRRGLYMALGSVATLLVLAAAIIEGPKLLQSSANSAAPQVAAPVENKAVESTAAPAAPSPQPAAQQDSPPPAQTAPAHAPAEPLATPVQAAAPQAPARSAPAQKQARGQSSPAAAPVTGQPPPQQSSQQPAPQAPPPAPARPSAAEMNELRQDYNQVAIRVGAAKSGLRALQQQMQRQGVDMRGDMLEAESRMDYLMKESMDSMRAGDADGSRTSLQMAERSLETIEKFLGR
jgi:eukaryotic-like serine/threonine-protein kinase